MCGLDETSFEEMLGERTGVRPHRPIGAFADPVEDVHIAFAALRASPFIENDTAIRGFVYDVETGLLDEV